MAKKFEVGDKVRIVSGDHDGKRAFVGRVGEVTKVDPTWACYPYYVTVDGNNAWLWQGRELEIVVEDKRKFNVGDRVRIVKARKPWKSDQVGKTVVITRINKRFDGDAASVRNEDGTRNRYVWYAEELELIAPVAPSPKYNVGDRVKVVGAGMPILATVRGFVVEDGYETRYFVNFNYGKGEYFESSLQAYTPRVWSSPSPSSSVGIDVIDPLVDEMIEALRKHGGDCETRRFGDAMVVVENGQAKIYRLEATSDV